MTLTNANYWWAPLGTPQPIIDKLASVLEQALQNHTVRRELNRLRMEPTFDQGDSFKLRMDATVQQFEAVVAQKQASLPNFPLYVGLLVAGLFVWVLIEALRSRQVDSELTGFVPQEDYVKRPGIAVASLVMLCLYVLVLGRGMLPFPVVTAAMVLAVGGLMMRSRVKSRWIVLLQLAFLTGLGTQFVFTELFVTPLP